ITRQIELADNTDDPHERAARCTFVVVGAGYTGTEVAAHGTLFTRDLARPHERLRDQPIRWLLLDLAPRVMAELDRRLSTAADRDAQRQGNLVAGIVAASYGTGSRRPYRHRDLGFVVDLGGAQAAANPLHVPMAGPVAKAVTRGYHLLAMPANRARVLADWILDAMLPRQGVQLGLVRSPAVPLDTASPELPRAFR